MQNKRALITAAVAGVLAAGTIALANPAVAGYVDHYLGDGITSVEEAGYVPLPGDQLSETIGTWEAR